MVYDPLTYILTIFPQEDRGDILFPKALKNILIRGALLFLKHATMVVFSRLGIKMRDVATERNLLISMRMKGS